MLRLNGRAASRANAEPRSMPYQMRLPSALRGPSHIRSTACASAAVRQLDAGALGVPQILAFALNVQVRGSSMTPSATPSLASHAAIADEEAWASFSGAMT